MSKRDIMPKTEKTPRMPILLLLAAHLSGDFVFQSNKLFEEKYVSWHGTAKHALIITICNIFLLFPYWQHWQAWVAMSFVGALHFVQDFVKVGYDKEYNEEKSPIPFFVDQVSHLIIIFAFGLWMSYLPTNGVLPILESPAILGLFTLMIFVSYVFDIVKFQFAQHENPSLKYKIQSLGMLHRIAIFGIIYFIFLLLYGFGA